MRQPAGSISSQAEWQRQLAGEAGMSFAFLWGLAEATFFFMIPDVFLSFVAMLAWPRTWRHILAAIAGAFIGGAIFFHWAATNPEQARRAVLRVPFVRESMLAKVDDGFQKQGLTAVFVGSISGIPYKLYAVEAPKFCSPAEFLLATPPARAVRFLFVWLGFGAVATWLRIRRGWQTASLVRVHAAIWIAIYAFYWGRIALS